MEGNLFKQAFDNLGMSIESCAESLGITQAYVYALRAGSNSIGPSTIKNSPEFTEEVRRLILSDSDALPSVRSLAFHWLDGKKLSDLTISESHYYGASSAARKRYGLRLPKSLASIQMRHESGGVLKRGDSHPIFYGKPVSGVEYCCRGIRYYHIKTLGIASGEEVVDSKILSERIKGARVALGFTMDEMVLKGVKKAKQSKAENYEKYQQAFTFQYLYSLSRVLGVSIDDLLARLTIAKFSSISDSVITDTYMLVRPRSEGLAARNGGT